MLSLIVSLHYPFRYAFHYNQKLRGNDKLLFSAANNKFMALDDHMCYFGAIFQKSEK
jgi:hypothetical protein